MKNSLVKFNRSNPIFRDDVVTRFDDFFDSVFNHFITPFGPIAISESGYPKVNVIEKTDSYVIEASVPGMNKNNIKITTKDGIVRISGERRNEQEINKENYLCRELKCSSFSRSFDFDGIANFDQITSKLENGILIINVPKKKEIIEKEEFKEIKIE
jgi:HSP20 family protein